MENQEFYIIQYKLSAWVTLPAIVERDSLKFLSKEDAEMFILIANEKGYSFTIYPTRIVKVTTRYEVVE